MKRGTTSAMAPGAGVSLGTALAGDAPFFWLGNVSGHDFGFMRRPGWMPRASGEKNRLSQVDGVANHGYGEAAIQFFIRRFHGCWGRRWLFGAGNAVPGIFIALVQTIGGLSSYALAAALRGARR